VTLLGAVIGALSAPTWDSDRGTKCPHLPEIRAHNKDVFNSDTNEEAVMKKFTEDFTVQVDGVKGVCPAGEAWAEQSILQGRIPVLSCEGPCVRGDIARRAADMVAQEEPFTRACYPETAFVPHSAMARWVKSADKVIVIDGCFLKCIGRVVHNLVDEASMVHIDALPLYNRYTDLFAMEDVPEAERIDAARSVAEQILPDLREL
jgi:uncharacterized metal-binding protein